MLLNQALKLGWLVWFFFSIFFPPFLPNFCMGKALWLLLHNSACVWSECSWTEQRYLSFHSWYCKEQYCTKAEQRWTRKNNDIFQTTLVSTSADVCQVSDSCHQWKCAVTSKHRKAAGFSLSLDCMFTCIQNDLLSTWTLFLESNISFSLHFSCGFEPAVFDRWNFQSAQVKIPICT